MSLQGVVQVVERASVDPAFRAPGAGAVLGERAYVWPVQAIAGGLPAQRRSGSIFRLHAFA